MMSCTGMSPALAGKYQLKKPASFQDRCFTGSQGATNENCSKSINQNLVDFSASGNLTVVVGWEKGVVTIPAREYVFSGFNSWWLMIIPFVVFLLFSYILLKFGRDPKKITTIAPEFSPPQNLTIPEMGTILDDRVEPADLTSQIIFWATKGYIKIKEEEKTFLRGQNYTLIKLKDLPQHAKSFEKMFFEALFKN